MDVATLLDQIENERYRMVLQKVVLDGMDYDELAKITGLKKSNLYNIKKRAMAELEKIARLSNTSGGALCAIKCEEFILHVFGIHKTLEELRILASTKDWLKEGNLNCYHLPIFTNLELFIHTLKMNFCRKYYGENDFSKITPDRVILKFIHTKFKSFKDLSSNEKVLKYYKNIYKNEIIWADGFVLNNAFISENGKINFNNQEKNIKNKMNIIGITYTIEQFFEENVNESETNSINDEDEEEEEKSESKEKESVSEEKNKIKDNKLKVYIYGNGDQCLYNKYFENETIGYVEFEFDSDEKIEQDFIYKNDIKITIEDLEDLF